MRQEPGGIDVPSNIGVPHSCLLRLAGGSIPTLIEDSEVPTKFCLGKVKIELATDGIKKIPLLVDIEPERVLQFLRSVKGVEGMHLVRNF
jgi:hypothetical protein